MNIRTNSTSRRGRFLAAAAIAIGAAGLPLVVGADDPAKQSTERTARRESGGAKVADQEAVTQALGKVVSAATSQQAGAGGIQVLVDCFYEPDRQRFAALMQADQVGQAGGVGAAAAAEGRRFADAVARLRENFQMKYNRPPNFTEGGALGNEFVRVGGQMDESARTAGGRIESTARGGTSSSSSSASASVSSDGKTSSVSGERTSESSSSKSGGTSSSSSSASVSASGSSEKASEKGSGTSGTGAAGGGASGTGPASTTDAAGAARPSQGNIAKTQDPGGGTSGSASTGTREKLSEQISGEGGAGGAGRAAAAAELPNSVTATIPASHGLPAVVVSLVREGNDWKINVPDTLSPQRLQANLARNMNVASQQRDQWPDDPKRAQQAIAHQVLIAIMDRNVTEAR